MVIDSSAILAILLGEPELHEFNRMIGADPVRLVSAVTMAEAGIVLDSRKGPGVKPDFDAWVRAAGLEIRPVDEAQAALARAAYRRFGKGIHPARLNLGDCFSYALAKHTGQPLLFKGNDFTQTDIRRVVTGNTR